MKASSLTAKSCYGMEMTWLLLFALAVPVSALTDEEMAIEVLEVKGKTEYRNAAGDAWEALGTESALDVGSEIRTGLRSFARLRLGANSEVTVKSLTTVAIGALQSDEDEQAIRTNLAQKYGTVRAKVSHVGDLRNDFTISTPKTVLAIRGSEGEMHSYAVVERVKWFEGAATKYDDKRIQDLIRGDEATDKYPDPNASIDAEFNPSTNPEPAPDPIRTQPEVTRSLDRDNSVLGRFSKGTFDNPGSIGDGGGGGDDGGGGGDD